MLAILVRRRFPVLTSALGLLQRGVELLACC
jgi:hypothetical protein